MNQFYWPDVAATSQHLTDLAEYLAARDFSVTILASGGRYSADGDTAPSRQRHNAVTIRRFRTTSLGRATHLGRIVDYLSFYVQVLGAALVGPRYDAVVYLTTPPLIPFIGWIARIARGQRYVIWSMDLHPAAEVAAGMLRDGSPVTRLLWAIWRRAYRRADAVIALGEFMRERITAQGVASDRVVVAPPWARSFPSPQASAVHALRATLGLEGRFVVMYSGNAGVVHEFGAITEAMRLLKDDYRFFFLFIGNGPRRREIEEFARVHTLKNFAYRNYLARADVPAALAMADAHLVSLRPEFAGISVPSKLYGIMAAGRPTLFVGPRESEPGQTVLNAEAGEVVEPAQAQPGALVAAVLTRWLADADERARLGRNAKRAFRRNYELSRSCDRISALLASR